MNKLKRLLAKRGIIVKTDHKLQRQLIKQQIITINTMGWFTGSTPNIIYLALWWFGIYKSFNRTQTILHEYRHRTQLKRKRALWRTNRPSEIDADKFAERAKNRF